MTRSRLDQTVFGLQTFAKHVPPTCLTQTLSTRVFHSGSGAGRESQQLAAKLAENSNTETDPEPAVPIQQIGCEYHMTEPKTERMHLSQWDGDASGWRHYQQEVRLYKTLRRRDKCGRNGLRSHKLIFFLGILSASMFFFWVERARTESTHGKNDSACHTRE